jgi:hypothetical protein
MDDSQPADEPTLSRRAFLLAGGLAGTVATAGCVGADPTAAALTGELLAGKVVALGRDQTDPVVVDPAGTDRPVQDALDSVASGGGVVRLPPTTVFERGPVRPYTNTAVLGFGPDTSEVAIERARTDGVRFDRDPAVRNVRLDGFALNGPGTGTRSGVALHHAAGDTQNLAVGRLVLWGWSDTVYRVAEGVGPFQCRHAALTVYECDAGDRDGLFEFRSSYGPANWFGTVAVYPTATESGRDSTVWVTRGGEQRIDHLTVGGAAGPAVAQTRRGRLRVGSVHWEPESARSGAAEIVGLRGAGPAWIGGITHAAGTADAAYALDGDPDSGAPPGHNYLGPSVTTGPETTPVDTVVRLAAANDPARPSFYFGPATDVAVTHDDDRTGGLRALGRAGVGVG